MSRPDTWVVSPGEVIAVAKSLAADVGPAVTLTGSPSISVYKRVGRSWVDKSSDFNITSAQVNTGVLTTNRDASVAIGKGVSFVITAPTDSTGGEYSVEVSCGASDGTTPKSNVRLVVTREP